MTKPNLWGFGGGLIDEEFMIFSQCLTPSSQRFYIHKRWLEYVDSVISWRSDGHSNREIAGRAEMLSNRWYGEDRLEIFNLEGRAG